jgi:acetyl-CoA C-acetyltransferase
MQREVFVVAALRTAIGSFGGSLKDVPLSDLATNVVKAVLVRSGAPAGRIGHVVMGNVIPTEARDAYLSRVAAIKAGIPKETPAFNVNRLCGSGLQAIDHRGGCRIHESWTISHGRPTMGLEAWKRRSA